MPFRSPQEIWETALGSLQVQVSAAAYETWLRHTVGMEYDGEEFVVGASNAFVAEWLHRRMRSLLERTLADVLKHPVRVAVRVRGAQPTEPTPPAPGRYIPSPTSHGRPLGLAPNPRFTFDTFVVGDNSRLAYAAARAIAEAPGAAYNPLFLSAPPGTGKTHLLHALANTAHAQHRAALLTTGEQFVTDFVSSVREGRADEFRTLYRSAEMLLVDDLQFISGKRQSEESLFYTCVSLLSEGKQVALAADRPLHELPLAHSRLATRLKAGLLVDIRSPDQATRLSILSLKATQLPLLVPDQVLAFLAERPTASVSQLEGELTRVTASASLLGVSLTVELARQTLSPQAPPARATSQAAILDAVAIQFQVPLGHLLGRTRERSVVRARQMAMYLLRHHSGYSLEQIGRLLGGRDHTTVLHGVDKITRTLPTDPSLQEAEQAILRSL